MQRYFFEISYNGAAYHGWQRQKNANSVQAEVESALMKFWPENYEVLASGRTDAGVHCKCQYFHYDIDESFDIENLAHRLNSILPKDIGIANIFAVPPDAHARFSAEMRSYEYHIVRKKDVFLNGLAYRFERALNIHKMNEAAQIFTTFTDFQAFSKVNTDVNHFLCTIMKAEWRESEDGLKFYISANRFLRGMVRSIVGTMLLIGQNKISLDQLNEILNSKDRRNAGPSAPAHGLYLTDVTYPKAIFPNKS